MTDAEAAVRPLPVITELSQPFWEATQRGNFQIPRCTSCGRYCWLPERACPYCRTETLEWTSASGRGEVYSFVIVEQAVVPGFEAPYVVAVVTLEEGPRFYTNIVGIDPGEVYIGMPVEVSFEYVGGYGLPLFQPRAVDAGSEG